MKLDLLTNVTVVDDAIKDVIEHTKQKSRVIAIVATNLTRRHIYEATCNKI